jgi:hypothetical protein
MAVGSVFSRLGRPALHRPDPRLLGLLGLALLALAGALLYSALVEHPDFGWLGPRSPAPSRITYQQPSADQTPIGREAALASVLRFTGWEQAQLTGDLERAEPAYLFETPERASFRVDARSGEVLEVSRPDLLAGVPLGRQLEPDALEARATEYARERFLGFERLAPVERSASWASNGHLLHRFKWARLDEATGAELPTTVAVAVTADRGEAVWYLAQRSSLSVDTHPQVSRESAVASAAATAERLGRSAPGVPASVRLQVIFDDANRQRLIWAIAFRGETDAAGRLQPSLRLLIDAHTGQAVSSP